MCVPLRGVVSLFDCVFFMLLARLLGCSCVCLFARSYVIGCAFACLYMCVIASWFDGLLVRVRFSFGCVFACLTILLVCWAICFAD